MMWPDRIGGASERPVDRVVLGVGIAIALIAALIVLFTQGFASADGSEKRPVPSGQGPSTQVNAGFSAEDPSFPPNPASPNFTRPVLPAPGFSASHAASSGSAGTYSGGQGFLFTGSAPVASPQTVRGCDVSLLGAVIGLLSSLVGGSTGC